MGQKEKLIQKLKSLPKDMTFDELSALLSYLGYHPENKGKTSGSRVIFKRTGYASISFHKPHPQNELPVYVVKNVLVTLKKDGLI